MRLILDSIDEILEDSDSEMEDDSHSQTKKKKSSSAGNKKSSVPAWLRDDSNDITDFLDANAAKNIVG